MKIKFESNKEILVCRIVGRINERNADKLLENFEEKAQGLSVLIVLDQVSEIYGAGFVALYKISKLVKKIVFCCAASNERLQKTLRLTDFAITYPFCKTESEALSMLPEIGTS